MKNISQWFRISTPIGAALFLAFVVVACGGGNTDNKGATVATGDPVKGDWVVIHGLSDPENLNYLTSTDASSQEMHIIMYEALINTDNETLEQIPWIADSLPVVSEDKLSYEFRLKKEATFADGKPVTGNDFIFYLKALKNPYVTNAAPIRSYYARVDRAELIDNDPYRLRVVMAEPYYLGEQWAGGLIALPKHIWDPKGQTDKMTFKELNEGDPRKNPLIKEYADFFQDIEKGISKEYLIGSGPYVFDEWKRNDRVVFVRNDNYWNKDNKWGKAYPDKIIYRTINDYNAALVSLKSGEIDFMPKMEKVQYDREKKNLPNNNLAPAEYDYPSYNYIGYNQRNPLFTDKRVRQALSHAVNRKEIIEKIFFGQAVGIESPLYRKRPEYSNDLKPLDFNLEKSKQLLAEAGWTDSDGNGILDKMIDGKKVEFEFTIQLNSGNMNREQMALILIDALKQIGIKAKTTKLEWATFLERTRDGDYDAYMGGWASPVIEGDMYQIWHSKSTEQGGSNFVHFKSDRVDQLIETIRGEFDYEKRKVMYREIQQIIYDEQPYTFLVSELLTGAYHNRFQNVSFYPPRPCYQAQLWWVPASAQKYGTGTQTVASTE